MHSLDRARLADALDAAADGEPTLDVLLQVNLTDDPGAEASRPTTSSRWQSTSPDATTLALRGVMAVAPLDETRTGGVRATARLRASACARSCPRRPGFRRG